MAFTVRLGVLGLGRALKSMLPSILASPDFELVAGCDTSEQKTTAFAGTFGVPCHQSIAALCDDDIDAVYIATPHQFHADHACQVLAAGKHALVEKPMALTTDECHRMVDAAGRAGCSLVVGPSHGSDPQILMMRQLIQDGQVGALSMVSCMNYTDFLYRPRRPEELDTAQGGGIIFNQLPHQIDMFRTLDVSGGDVHRVHAVTGRWDPSRPTEGACTAIIELASGPSASLVYSGYARFSTDLLQGGWGEEGNTTDADFSQTRNRLAGMTSAEEANLKAKSGMDWDLSAASSERSLPHFGIFVVSCELADMIPTRTGVAVFTDTGRRDLVATVEGGPKAPTLEEFYLSITGRKEPLHSGLWATETVRACHAILRSATERRDILLSCTSP